MFSDDGACPDATCVDAGAPREDADRNGSFRDAVLDVEVVLPATLLPK